jgi:hypothetical protein
MCGFFACIIITQMEIVLSVNLHLCQSICHDIFIIFIVLAIEHLFCMPLSFCEQHLPEVITSKTEGLFPNLCITDEKKKNTRNFYAIPNLGSWLLLSYSHGLSVC